MRARTIRATGSEEDVLRATYTALNARSIEAVMELMHPEPGGASSNEFQSDTHVLHRYRLEDGLIVRMDVLEPPH